MYKIRIRYIENQFEYHELIKVFLPPTQFEIYTDEKYAAFRADAQIKAEDDNPCGEEDQWVVFNEANFGQKDAIKREIYQGLAQLTGLHPAWGILTGVRPVKLAGELIDRLGSTSAVKEKLTEFYLLSEEKADLLLRIWAYQQKILGKPKQGSVGVYIGIPFCPTRCLYCSFTSNQKGLEEIQRYLDALHREIHYCGQRMRETGLWAESIYIGGGTPTTLTAAQLAALMECIRTSIDLSRCREFTVEAGRPDTITIEKLQAIKDGGADRISINPQSMKEETLVRIGRSHTPSDIVKAFQKADWVEIGAVNADIIAGLPGETPEDFRQTLAAVLALEPENITVHTLAVKRASRLIEEAPDYHYQQAAIVSCMLEIAKKMLAEAGFQPYYLYRQKHMAGAFENVGYCRGDMPSIYNIRIMEEQQSILAMGAGGISKRYFPAENRLERIPNVSNYTVYIERLDEMLMRKEKFFQEG